MLTRITLGSECEDQSGEMKRTTETLTFPLTLTRYRVSLSLHRAARGFRLAGCSCSGFVTSLFEERDDTDTRLPLLQSSLAVFPSGDKDSVRLWANNAGAVDLSAS